ncbi:hypothetical protein DLM75_00775 [Leptospira stimsonii]|uniref:Uncharacterized protein n=1 Tax=Leptospira stimsonii TaxID=2202203 RepID=A0A396ZB98_9LEPT|nr:hypothetical protein DLM75_00775 [Leptospira stimsonii]
MPVSLNLSFCREQKRISYNETPFSCDQLSFAKKFFFRKKILGSSKRLNRFFHFLGKRFLQRMKGCACSSEIAFVRELGRNSVKRNPHRAIPIEKKRIPL